MQNITARKALMFDSRPRGAAERSRQKHEVEKVDPKKA